MKAVRRKLREVVESEDCKKIGGKERMRVGRGERDVGEGRFESVKGNRGKEERKRGSGEEERRK